MKIELVAVDLLKVEIDVFLVQGWNCLFLLVGGLDWMLLSSWWTKQALVNTFKDETVSMKY